MKYASISWNLMTSHTHASTHVANQPASHPCTHTYTHNRTHMHVFRRRTYLRMPERTGGRTRNLWKQCLLSDCSKDFAPVLGGTAKAAKGNLLCNFRGHEPSENWWQCPIQSPIRYLRIRFLKVQEMSVQVQVLKVGRWINKNKNT